MLAWHVHAGDPYEYSLLVFAATRGKAKLKACEAGLWDYGDYTDTRAVRAKEWDKFATEERVVETNADLPPDAPPFYAEED